CRDRRRPRPGQLEHACTPWGWAGCAELQSSQRWQGGRPDCHWPPLAILTYRPDTSKYLVIFAGDDPSVELFLCQPPRPLSLAAQILRVIGGAFDSFRERFGVPWRHHKPDR